MIRTSKSFQWFRGGRRLLRQDKAEDSVPGHRTHYKKKKKVKVSESAKQFIQAQDLAKVQTRLHGTSNSQLSRGNFHVIVGVLLSEQCTYNGTVYKSGDTFNDVDGCNTCSCDAGSVACSTQECRKFHSLFSTILTFSF